MANHGSVKTKKSMTHIAISKMLDGMNKDYFHSNLVISYTKGGWGSHTWDISYVSDNKEYAGRVMWLNNKNSFEMRHGGGPDFAWWIDSAILNEVACVFDGRRADDGVSGYIPRKIGKFKDFWEYKKRMLTRIKDENMRLYLIQLEQIEGFIPKEFQIDLGPEIQVEFQDVLK